MATLSKQHGRYFVQFYHKNRKPQRKRVSLRTSKKRDAEALRSKLERDYLIGRFDPWTDDPLTYDRVVRRLSDKTFKQALEAFLAQKKQDGKSANTLNSYRWIVGSFMDLIGSDTLIKDVSAVQVTMYVRDKGVSKSTSLARYRHLRAFFRWAEKAGMIEGCPTNPVSVPERPEKLPKSITEAELTRLAIALRAAYNGKRSKNKCREAELVWQIPLYWFAYYTGLRVSELARLRWKHIDDEKRLIHIYEQKNKKEQTVPLNRMAAAVLEAVEGGDPEDYVFRSPRENRRQRSTRRFAEHVSRTFSEARRLAGIGRKLTFHSLRHGFCTRLAEAGKPLYVIKDAARHADVSTSLIYVHMANEHLKAELDDVFG